MAWAAFPGLLGTMTVLLIWLWLWARFLSTSCIVHRDSLRVDACVTHFRVKVCSRSQKGRPAPRVAWVAAGLRLRRASPEPSAAAGRRARDLARLQRGSPTRNSSPTVFQLVQGVPRKRSWPLRERSCLQVRTVSGRQETASFPGECCFFPFIAQWLT